MRFTLSKMFLAIAMAALACAALASRTRWWADAVLSVTVFLYVAVALLAVANGGSSRKSRLAFALVGSGYLLLTVCTLFSPVRDSMVTNVPLALAAKGLDIHISPILYTPYPAPDTSVPGDSAAGATNVNAGTLTLSPGSLSGVVVGPSSGSVIVGATSGNWTAGPATFGEPDLDSFVSAGVSGGRTVQIGAFFIIGHCVWSWLFALLAGLLVSVASAKTGIPQKA